MILGGRPDGDTQETQIIELPPQPPELDFETRRYPIGETPPVRNMKGEAAPAKALPTPGPVTGVVAPDDLESLPEATPADAESVESQQEPIAAETVPEPLPEETSPQVVISPLASPSEISQEAGRYVVQVASFGALDNANRLAVTLRGYGYTVVLDSIKSDVGIVHRVRVGPYASESEATGAASRLRSQVENIKPRVMDMQPDKAAPVTQPTDPLVRWVVQVGTFSDINNADKLVARLRLESMSAYTEEVNRSGSVVYRVRVGPFLEREEAIKADQRVAERLSIDGVVMSAD